MPARTDHEQLRAARFVDEDRRGRALDHTPLHLHSVLIRNRPDCRLQSLRGGILKLLSVPANCRQATGYSGRGDFSMAADGRLKRRGERDVVPFVYAGAAILTPVFFGGVAPGPSSMSPLFDRAIERGRIHGLRLEGVWMHVGTPDAVAAAEAALLASVA